MSNKQYSKNSTNSGATEDNSVASLHGLRFRDQDTIVAQATPSGFGGISVIRISGNRAYDFSRKICSFLPKQLVSHKAYFGNLIAVDATAGRAVDEVVVTVFAEGKSYTGEETVEVSCHGNPLIVKDIIDQYIFCGARGADRGEFTYRAFMNGKIDLVQAEGVLSLIQSQSQRSSQQALRQLQGRLSDQFESIENDLTWCLAHIEASIDFSTEGIDVVDNDVLVQRIEKIIINCQKLINSYRGGQILKDGFCVALVGRPNAGKSSLLNSLLGEEKAIVTHIPGTTRDVIEGSLLISGCKVVFSDTAGLREATDLVEKIGIQKSRDILAKADLVFYVVDVSAPVDLAEIEDIAQLPMDKTVFVLNKTDLLSEQNRTTIADKFVKNLHGKMLIEQDMICATSTLQDKESLALRSIIGKKLETFHFEDSAVLFQSRQYECLLEAARYLKEAKDLVLSSSSPEILALPLKEALLKTHEVLGKHFDDQIMDRVFKEFCIGK